MDDEKKTSEYIFGELIFAYTRQDAICDGLLLDVSKVAAEFGITIPTALTERVYETCVRVPLDANWQDESGRLWDVLGMYACAAKWQKMPDVCFFTVFVQNNVGPAKPIRLKALVHAGDDNSAVLTIMFPDED